jgi:hypothetical protein
MGCAVDKPNLQVVCSSLTVLWSLPGQRNHKHCLYYCSYVFMNSIFVWSVIWLLAQVFTHLKPYLMDIFINAHYVIKYFCANHYLLLMFLPSAEQAIMTKSKNKTIKDSVKPQANQALLNVWLINLLLIGMIDAPEKPPFPYSTIDKIQWRPSPKDTTGNYGCTNDFVHSFVGCCPEWLIICWQCPFNLFNKKSCKK